MRVREGLTLCVPMRTMQLLVVTQHKMWLMAHVSKLKLGMAQYRLSQGILAIEFISSEQSYIKFLSTTKKVPDKLSENKIQQ